MNPCVCLQIPSWIFGVVYFCFLSWKRCKNYWPYSGRGGDSSGARECAITLSLPLRSRICAAIDYRHDSWSSHGGAHAMDNMRRYRAKRALVIRSGATINQHADLKTTDSIHHGHIIFSYTSPAPKREDWLKCCVGIHFFLQENQMLVWVWWFHFIIKSKHCCCWFHYPGIKFCFSLVKPDHPEGIRRYNL